MNLKIIKQKAAQVETPIKNSESIIQLSQYFSRPTQQLLNKKHKNTLNRELGYKENIDPNIQDQQKNINGKQSSNQRTPKRKVIHLKSITKNSKSLKDGNSGSLGKKYSVQHTYTQVADFDNQGCHSRPTIKIDVDLKNHRRSMQDTLVSSNAQNQLRLNNVENIPHCDQHTNKKATFIVKGKPFCDKCSVKLITKGFVAVKIKNQKNQQYFQFVQNCSQETEKKKRDIDLKNFIQDLDKMQPILESIGTKLDSYLGWLAEYCQFEFEKFEQNWLKLLHFLDSFKQHLITNFKAQQQKAQKVLKQARIKIRQQTTNLSFMRNDIVRNIDLIIDQTTVPYQKYANVMESFRTELQQIHQNALTIQKSNLNLPKAQFNLYEFDKQIHKSVAIKLVSQQLFQNKKTMNNAKNMSILQNEQDPYRLSFGKQLDKVQSPTFKII